MNDMNFSGIQWDKGNRAKKLPSDLLAAVKLKAKNENIPYNRIIRRALEREVG